MPERMLVRVIAFILSFFIVMTCLSSVYGSEQLPWGTERIRAYCVWDNNRDMIVDSGSNAGENVNVAIIDTGIWYWEDNQGGKHYHDDLADNVRGLTAFQDQFDGKVIEVDPMPDYWGHGTHCAGVVAAADNESGVIGGAPKVSLYIIQMIRGTALECAAAINWSVANGMNIISISWQFPHYEPLRAACQNAYDHDLFIIACSGNENSAVSYPAAYDDWVVAVGAVYPNDTRLESSNYGPELDFVAPGYNVNSTGLDNGYALMSGTSAACPHVSAAAALINSSKIDPDYDINNNTYWDNDEILQKLRDTALDLGSTEQDDYYGYGLVNAWFPNQRPTGNINNDLYVNARDAIIMGLAFGSKPGDQNWDPRADIDINKIVNAKDSTILGEHFGEVDP